jgi:hypothetical protein
LCLQRNEQCFDRVPTGGGKEVDTLDLCQALPEASNDGFEILFAVLGFLAPGQHRLRAARLTRELEIVGFSSRVEQRLDLGIRKAFDEPGLAH